MDIMKLEIGMEVNFSSQILQFNREVRANSHYFSRAPCRSLMLEAEVNCYVRI